MIYGEKKIIKKQNTTRPTERSGRDLTIALMFFDKYVQEDM
jgi:hypothetical protein